MGNRYAEDIKRIVGIDPNQSKLGDAPNRPSIPGKRGIGYINPTTRTAEGVSGTSSTTQLSDDIGANQQDAAVTENNAGEEGLNPYEVYNGAGDETTGVKSAKDIIDGTDSAAKLSLPQVTDAGLGYSNNDGLSAINAVDCDTGKDVEIRTRNDYLPPDDIYDDNDNLIYNRWDDASTPSFKAGYTPGSYYEIQGAGVPTNYAQGVTIYTAILSFNTLLNAQQGDAPFTFSRYEASGAAYLVYYTGDSGAEYSFPMNAVSCTGTPPDVGSTCPASAPLEEFWPQDNKYTVKLYEGRFVGSEYDADLPLKYKNPSSRIDFCFDTGGSRTGSVEVTKDGGFMIYETSGGVPTGITRVYDNTGQMVSAFDYASGWHDVYRP